jgi:hypothetical protein
VLALVRVDSKAGDSFICSVVLGVMVPRFCKLISISVIGRDLLFL